MINRYFVSAAIIANAVMVSAAGAETFTISCERQTLYLGNIPTLDTAEHALPATSQFTLDHNEFTTNSFGSLVNVNSGTVRQRGSRYELRFSFRYSGGMYDYTMDYNPNSGSYRQVIVSREYNVVVGSAEGDCRRL